MGLALRKVKGKSVFLETSPAEKFSSPLKLWMENIFQIEENALNYFKNRQPQEGNWEMCLQKSHWVNSLSSCPSAHPTCSLGFFKHHLIRGVIFRRALGRAQLEALCASGEQAGGDSVPSSTEDVTCSTQTCVPSYLLSLLLPPLISVNFTIENINSIPAQSLY